MNLQKIIDKPIGELHDINNFECKDDIDRYLIKWLKYVRELITK
jgi:hypothetical protein